MIAYFREGTNLGNSEPLHQHGHDCESIEKNESNCAPTFLTFLDGGTIQSPTDTVRSLTHAILLSETTPSWNHYAVNAQV